ncbi:MAG: glycine-rich protein, partial [Oscillospiraceae bacterium]
LTKKVGDGGSSYTPTSSLTLYAKWTDTTKPTISLNPNTQTTYVSGGKAVTVNLSDSGSGLKASQPIYYAWSTSNATVPTSWSSVTSTNTAGAKSTTVTVPATSNSSLTGTYYLWIKAGTLSDVSGNTSNQVVSALFKFDNTNPTVSVSTSKTTNSITAGATATALSGISKYEYSKDNGATWVANGTSNTYTFNGLTHNTSYNIKVRVTSGTGKQAISETVTVLTDTIPLSTFAEMGTSTKNVTITYPSGCGSTYTCSYSKNGGADVKITSTSATVSFSEDGTVVSKVTDGNNITYSSYSVMVIYTMDDLKKQAVTTGDGLYSDSYETGRYVYKGANPNNYITFNEEIWRIVSIESDSSAKIVKQDPLTDYQFDDLSNRTLETNTFCTLTDSYGCNVYGAMPGIYTNGSKSGTITKDSSLATYLNNDWYSVLNSDKKYIINHSFNIGGVSSTKTLITDAISEEKKESWIGRVGLLSNSDYIKASTDSSCKGMSSAYATGNCSCKNKNYLQIERSWHLITPNYDTTHSLYHIETNGCISANGSGELSGKMPNRPVVFLNNNIQLSGKGTTDNPYKINADNITNTPIAPSAPTFTEVGTSTKTVTITYPSGCGSTYSCSYIKNNDAEINVTSNKATVSFEESGTLIAKVVNSDNKVISSTHTIITKREYEYKYTNKAQTFKAPETGYYKIELWGAQGGYSQGKGAYTSGEIYLDKNEMLYVYTGGKGVTPDSTAIGGYNGGGNTIKVNGKSGGTGGGATDVRLVGGTWNDATSLRSRIMVAGGGGGSAILGNSGLIGQDGNVLSYEYYTSIGKGGSQTYGGAVPTLDTCTTSNGTAGGFGYGGTGGGSSPSNVETGGGAGGGGGYYGGSGASGLCNGSFYAGGGSSYISGYAGVNSVTSSSSGIHTNKTKHYSGKYFINTSLNYGDNVGEGKAVITYIGKNPSRADSTKITSVRYIKDCINGNTINDYNHWVEIQAINKGENVAKGKTVTGILPEANNTTYAFANAVDGKIDNANGNAGFAYMSGTGNQCLTVDLGQEYDLEEIRIWHYFADNRTYYHNTTSVAGSNGTYRNLRYDQNAVTSSNGISIKNNS